MIPEYFHVFRFLQGRILSIPPLAFKFLFILPKFSKCCFFHKASTVLNGIISCLWIFMIFCSNHVKAITVRLFYFPCEVANVYLTLAQVSNCATCGLLALRHHAVWPCSALCHRGCTGTVQPTLLCQLLSDGVGFLLGNTGMRNQVFSPPLRLGRGLQGGCISFEASTLIW